MSRLRSSPGISAAIYLRILPSSCLNLVDVLVTYDIADTEGTGQSRLRRVSGICEKYGQRVQFSVFECRLSNTKLARMIGEIEEVIDQRRDSVIVYRFPGAAEDAKIKLGRKESRKLGEPWIF
ncbi:MAG: CRISPR-associated endonuclease Cas2 [Chloroflexi bacterium]|nr:CRISPR-associated endonuclease Cas2 [Chloroflexota bacterium]